uniref:Uncharacterized protein n=1 Tax=Rhizophora mucronata TaxID=61149 RepID=A0A2P2PE33_RHIMU
MIDILQFLCEFRATQKPEDEEAY